MYWCIALFSGKIYLYWDKTFKSVGYNGKYKVKCSGGKYENMYTPARGCLQLLTNIFYFISKPHEADYLVGPLNSQMPF